MAIFQPVISLNNEMFFASPKIYSKPIRIFTERKWNINTTVKLAR